jgi:hypothetical protein
MKVLALIALVGLVYLSVALPFKEQIALLNSLEVGRN